ncbi:MAG: hypothetical protein COZ06_23055 [Armatimonadetes bacterium CG_4_10_14_3_um_filter_66_18]|nr:MAG: hypothetical protein COZ06_23055 [Armatimonadetes bacterium CG_4_10_14_3_um_filter_66_18]PIZ42881.1 MAG: hypothetical protein COY42_16735 [Armatimonadetes bacterium CG_4_10_14_0_8_um_filter_66_14]
MSALPLTIDAHYDGKVIVPDEPVDLPENQPLRVALHLVAPGKAMPPPDRRAALERLLARGVRRVSIPDEALRRESLYRERL